MQPTIGRSVHFQSYGQPNDDREMVTRAALVVAIDPDNSSCSLCVFSTSGMYFRHHVRFSEEPKLGCWNWPPRVP
jgi:hypothetical protein